MALLPLFIKGSCSFNVPKRGYSFFTLPSAMASTMGPPAICNKAPEQVLELLLAVMISFSSSWKVTLEHVLHKFSRFYRLSLAAAYPFCKGSSWSQRSSDGISLTTVWKTSEDASIFKKLATSNLKVLNMWKLMNRRSWSLEEEHDFLVEHHWKT